MQSRSIAAPRAQAHGRSRSASLNFVRHYAEMLAAMFLGMLGLGMGVVAILSLMGVERSSLETDAPALVLLGMAFTMTAPMVGWMRYRGHGWAPTGEMAASMFVPTFAAIALLGGGLLTNTDTLLGIQHVAMFPAMLAVMLLRRGEYSGRVGPKRTREPL